MIIYKCINLFSNYFDTLFYQCNSYLCCAFVIRRTRSFKCILFFNLKIIYSRFDRGSCWRYYEKRGRRSTRRCWPCSWRRISQKTHPKRLSGTCSANSWAPWTRPDGRTAIPTSPITRNSYWSSWNVAVPKDSVRTAITTRRWQQQSQLCSGWWILRSKVRGRKVRGRPSEGFRISVVAQQGRKHRWRNTERCNLSLRSWRC